MRPCRPGRQGELADVGRLQVSLWVLYGGEGGSLRGGRVDLQTQEV